MMISREPKGRASSEKAPARGKTSVADIAARLNAANALMWLFSSVITRGSDWGTSWLSQKSGRLSVDGLVQVMCEAHDPEDRAFSMVGSSRKRCDRRYAKWPVFGPPGPLKASSPEVRHSRDRRIAPEQKARRQIARNLPVLAPPQL